MKPKLDFVKVFTLVVTVLGTVAELVKKFVKESGDSDDSDTPELTD